MESGIEMSSAYPSTGRTAIDMAARDQLHHMGEEALHRQSRRRMERH